MSLVSFTCNICGHYPNLVTMDQLSRETGGCAQCGSVVRLRSLIALLSLQLHGEVIPVPEWPHQPNVVGYGVSDWPVYSKYLSDKVDYRNTQFDDDLVKDRAFLDITAPPSDLLGTADFVICSEVLEHVEPPVHRAFHGLFRLLKPGGVLIFSVPYWFNQTLEHFPDLYQWKIENINGERVLVNKTRAGDEQQFTNLRFHGGGSAVLEMRIFGFEDMQRALCAVGFDAINVAEDCLPYGIHFPEAWSLPMLARKPI